ncbi:hypothetical protein BDW71DRAFT_114156 [Aspergillus fruticulosus]
MRRMWDNANLPCRREEFAKSFSTGILSLVAFGCLASKHGFMRLALLSYRRLNPFCMHVTCTMHYYTRSFSKESGRAWNRSWLSTGTACLWAADQSQSRNIQIYLASAWTGLWLVAQNDGVRTGGRPRIKQQCLTSLAPMSRVSANVHYAV